MGTPNMKHGKTRRSEVVAIAVVALFLCILWAKGILNLVAGNHLGYVNFYGQQVGTVLLLATLVVVTPVFVVLAWRRLKAG